MQKIEWQASAHQSPPEILIMIPKSGAFNATFFILFSITKMKNTTYLSITTSWWKTYDKLTVYKDCYKLNPNRTYFWIEDEDEQEPGHFCDLSENHPDIPDSEIFGRLPGHEAIIIDNDFLMCFNSPREAKIWIRDNIPECVITWDIDWRDCFYIKHDWQDAN